MSGAHWRFGVALASSSGVNSTHLVLRVTTKAGLAAGLSSTNPSREQELLLGSDRVLGSLGQVELRSGLGLDLDGFARLRIASHASLAVHLLQAAQTGYDENPVLLGFLDGGVSESLQERRRGLVGRLELLCEVTHQLCLGHTCSHESSSMEQLGLLRCAPSYTSGPVEKQRFPRILRGFYRGKGPERHKNSLFHD